MGVIIYSYTLIISFLALSGFLFIYMVIAINYWIRDVIREYTKKYEVLIIMLFIVFLVFVFSEGLLFLSFFWVFFHSSCSPNINTLVSGIYVPDPCELTYTNTLLLSNAALSLGCTFICRSCHWQLRWKHFNNLVYTSMDIYIITNKRISHI